jgi:hypothetical protein
VCTGLESLGVNIKFRQFPTGTSYFPKRNKKFHTYKLFNCWLWRQDTWTHSWLQPRKRCLDLRILRKTNRYQLIFSSRFLRWFFLINLLFISLMDMLVTERFSSNRWVFLFIILRILCSTELHFSLWKGIRSTCCWKFCISYITDKTFFNMACIALQCQNPRKCLAVTNRGDNHVKRVLALYILTTVKKYYSNMSTLLITCIFKNWNTFRLSYFTSSWQYLHVYKL